MACQLELKVLANDSEKKTRVRIVLTYDSPVKKQQQKIESTVAKISKNFLQKKKYIKIKASRN